jgi:RNA polymerase sigma factor (sigma-70 family)
VDRPQQAPQPDGTVPPSSTIRLLWAARGGDAEALDLLFARVAPKLRRWARGRLPRWARRGEDTVDVVQDALLGVLGHLDHFEPRRSRALEAYLKQAVRNRVRDLVRRHERRGADAVLDSDPPAPSRSPLDEMMEADRARRFSRACASLTEGERELVVARLELGYSYEQIALVTGRNSADAARMALKRAIVRLAEHMAASS